MLDSDLAVDAADNLIARNPHLAAVRVLVFHLRPTSWRRGSQSHRRRPEGYAGRQAHHREQQPDLGEAHRCARYQEPRQNPMTFLLPLQALAERLSSTAGSIGFVAICGSGSLTLISITVPMTR